MALTDAQIRAAGPRMKPWKLFDGRGLYLLIHPNGSRYWRLKYRVAGREQKLALGVYPEVGLRAARDARDQARLQMRAGIDPSVQRKVARVAKADTFEAVALEWLRMLEHPPVRSKGKKPKRPRSKATIDKKRSWLDDYVFPSLRGRPIAEIEPPELLAVLRKVEARGIFETTHRVRSTCGFIFRYGIATGRCKRDITADLRDALQPVVVTHHAALTDPVEVGGLLRAIDGYRGEPVTCIALKLLPMHFLRSSDWRFGRWHEINFDAREWRVPPGRMKMKELFVIPLAQQALTLFRELYALTFRGPDSLMFPGMLNNGRAISENTINAALRRMGYTGEQMTGHGWRTVASTFLNEQGWDPDVIELQLDHVERDEVRAAYNRAQRLDYRRRMMQAYADYLDGLRAGGNVIPIRRAESPVNLIVDDVLD